jgi:hypothetical protein
MAVGSSSTNITRSLSGASRVAPDADRMTVDHLNDLVVAILQQNSHGVSTSLIRTAVPTTRIAANTASRGMSVGLPPLSESTTWETT